jgi:outer membrane protein assembly factor BamC
MMKMKLLLPLSVLALAACTTTFESKKVDYQTQGKQGPGLEVPPDLSQLTKNAQASVPVGGAINASAYKSGSSGDAVAGAANNGASVSTASTSTIAVNAIGGMHIQREGTQRWLVVDGRPPEKLWDEVRDFWIASGFTFAIDESKLGIMETNWSENRAKLPQDGIRKYLGGLLGDAFATNERDKYRTRLERTANGGTEIYISHRGLAEDFVTSDHAQMMWKPRPVDPELEIEFLNRLMLRMGGTPEAGKLTAATPAKTGGGSVVAAPVENSRAYAIQGSDQTSLVLNDAFDQAWRRVGLSLDRTSFTVEDRDRSKGVYFVRYVDPDAEKNAPGFFAKMFGAKEKDALQKYQVVVKREGEKTRINVANTAGQVLTTADAKNILKVLLDDLK